jgi:hypothetical protein
MTTIKVNDLFSLELTKDDTYGYVGLFSKKQNGMYSGYLDTFMLLNAEIEDVVHSLILCFKNQYNEDTLNVVEQKSILLLRDFYVNK